MWMRMDCLKQKGICNQTKICRVVGLSITFILILTMVYAESRHKDVWIRGYLNVTNETALFININVSSNLTTQTLTALGNISANFYHGDGSLLTGITTSTSAWNSSSTNVYLNDSNGKVGIGTNTPLQELVVIGDVNITQGLITGNVTFVHTNPQNFDNLRISQSGNNWVIDAEVDDSDTNTLIFQLGVEQLLIIGLGATGGTIDSMDIGIESSESNFARGKWTFNSTKRQTVALTIVGTEAGIGSSVNLTEWYNKSGKLIVSINPDGDIVTIGDITTETLLVKSPPVECPEGTYMTYTNLTTNICVAAMRVTGENVSFDYTFRRINVTGTDDNSTFTGDLKVIGTIHGGSAVKVAGVNITGNVFSLTEDRNQSSRFTLTNLNNGSNASAVIEAINDMGSSMFFGIGSSNFELGDIGSPNITVLISRSRGDMIFGNAFKEAFIWYNNPQDDDDLNNLVEIMRLNNYGLNISENLTINGVLILPNIVELSPSSSTILRRDDDSGIVGAKIGIQGNDVGEADHKSGAAYVWIVENGTINYTIDLHGSLDPNNPNQVVHHLRGNVTGETWRLDNPSADAFIWETKLGESPLLKLNRTGLFNVNDTFWVFPNGNVAIGTLDDANGLTVAGNATFAGAWTADSSRLGAKNIARPQMLNEVATSTNPNIVMAGGDTDSGLGRQGANTLALITAGSSRIFINAVGDVGIGNTIPNETLHVSGNVTIQSFLNITGDNNANATIYLNQLRIWNNGSGICINSC